MPCPMSTNEGSSLQAVIGYVQLCSRKTHGRRVRIRKCYSHAVSHILQLCLLVPPPSQSFHRIRAHPHAVEQSVFVLRTIEISIMSIIRATLIHNPATEDLPLTFLPSGCCVTLPLASDTFIICRFENGYAKWWSVLHRSFTFLCHGSGKVRTARGFHKNKTSDKRMNKLATSRLDTNSAAT